MCCAKWVLISGIVKVKGFTGLIKYKWKATSIVVCSKFLLSIPDQNAESLLSVCSFVASCFVV